MEPRGPSEDAHAGKHPASSTKRMRMELVNKIPDNPKRLVFESTQQRYEIPLRQDEGLPSSHLTTFDSRPSPSCHPLVAPTSGDHSQRRTHGAQRTLERVPSNLKRVVFESTQERFVHQIRQDHVFPSAAGHDSDDDFMPYPNIRASTHIGKSKHTCPRKTRHSRAGLSTDESTEGDGDVFSGGPYSSYSERFRISRFSFSCPYEAGGCSRDFRCESVAGEWAEADEGAGEHLSSAKQL